jgi:hypothetical protein
MAVSAGNEGFPSAGGHDLDPPRSLALSFVLQVFQGSNMVDFHLLPWSAEFADVGQESFFEFWSACPHWGERVIEDGCVSACECDASPSGYQGFLSSFSFNGDLENLSWPVRGLNGGFIAVVDLRYADTKFLGQRCDKGPFHHPLETVELIAVDGKLILLCQSSEFLLLVRDDTVDGIIATLFPLSWLAVFLGEGACGFDDLHRDW